MPGGYAPRLTIPAPLPSGAVNAPVGSFMRQAQGMAAPGQMTQGQVPYAQPADQGPLTRLAYQMAGAPPQPSVVPGSLKATPLTVMPDPGDILRGSGGDIAGSALGAANSLSSAYRQGNNLYDGLFGGSSLAGVGSGAVANGALADAGFGAGWTTPLIDTGAGAAGVGAGLEAVGGTGTGALGATSFAGASPSSAAAIVAAAGGSSAGALAGSGLSTALPLAAVGWAVADALNKSGDLKSAGTSALLSGMVKNAGWTLKDPRTQTYQLPDGRLIRTGEEARAVSEALRSGDSNAQQLYEAWLATAKAPKG